MTYQEPTLSLTDFRALVAISQIVCNLHNVDRYYKSPGTSCYVFGYNKCPTCTTGTPCRDLLDVIADQNKIILTKKRKVIRAGVSNEVCDLVFQLIRDDPSTQVRLSGTLFMRNSLEVAHHWLSMARATLGMK